MGTSEEGSNPPLEIETQNQIHLGTSSNGTHHEVVVHGVDDDHHDQNQNQNQNPPSIEESAIVEQLDNLELQSNVDAANDEREKVEEEREEEEGEGKTQNYPLRPNATDCAFYIKTGACKYGLNCRFNHPPKRVFKPVGEKEKSTEELNEVVTDTKKIECKYFSTQGGCKYGDACRYNHPSEEFETTDPELNFLGLPIRPMEKECTFYMRTGTCAYGANCRFNHPDPTAANDPEPGNSLANGYSLITDNDFPKTNGPMHSTGVLQGTLSNGVNSRNSAPYASNMSSYHQLMPQNPGWNQNQVIVSLSANKPTLPHQIVDLSKKQDPSANYERLMQIEEFPERPGQPDCDYFMKTGDCKYRSACRYNHPISRSSRLPLPPISSKGLYSRSEKVSPVETTNLHNSYSSNARKTGMRFDNNQKMQNGGFPERPGQPECEYFMKTGNCKFKSACRYNHPRNRVPASIPCALNEKGLPLRPGAKICRNYEHQGTCQYSRRCLFHHPDYVSPAAQVSAEDNRNHPSSNVAVSNLEPPVSNNVESNWDDGWVM